MTDKALAARIRMLRRLGVAEFECKGDDLRIVMGPEPNQGGRTSVKLDEDEPELTGHPSQFLQEYYKKQQAQAEGEREARGPRRRS